MTRSFTLSALLVVSLLVLLAWGDSPSSSPEVEMPRAVEVYRDYCPDLLAEGHIEDCWTGYVEEALHLVVVTDTPALVPPELDTILILTAAPPAPLSPEQPASEQPEGGQPAAVMPRAVEVYRDYCPDLLAEEHITDCWTGYVEEALHLVVVTDEPALVPSALDTIPVRTAAPPPTPPAPSAVMPWEVEVYREYCPALTEEAHIEDCWTGYVDEELHLVVVTDTPTLVPAEQDTIPILTAAPPSTPPAPLTVLPQAVAVYRASCPALLAEVYVEDCWTGYVGEALHLVVVTDSPDLIPSEVDSIPTLPIAPSDPPTEDDADTSEADSQDTGSALDRTSGQENAEASGAETQPGTTRTEGASTETPQNPPIAGIPYATAQEIFNRHPFDVVDGVWDVRLEADGIVVRTTQPALIPSSFEGLPVQTKFVSVGTRFVGAVKRRRPQ